MAVLTTKNIIPIINAAIDNHPTILAIKAVTDNIIPIINAAIDNHPIVSSVKEIRAVTDNIIPIINDTISKNPIILAMQEEQHQMRLMIEGLQSDMQKLLEICSPLLKKAERVDQHEAKLVDCSEKIDITQTVLKAHVTNKRIHLDS